MILQYLISIVKSFVFYYLYEVIAAAIFMFGEGLR